MKDYLCVFLSACLVVSTSCSTDTQNRHRPAPSQPASQDQIEQTEKNFNDVGNQQTDNSGKSSAEFSLAKAYLDNAVNTLMANSNMRIKDYDGNDLSLSVYKTNPTQGFVLLADEDGYSVLKTSVDTNSSSSQNTGKVNFTYQVFKMDGDMDDFRGKDLGEPVLEEALAVDAKNLLSSKDAITDLFNRLKGVELAYSNASFQDQLAGFLFPTAYASSKKDYKKKLLITAIVFTSIAVLSYIFAFFPIGDISTAVAIVMWLLYAFQDE